MMPSKMLLVLIFCGISGLASCTEWSYSGATGPGSWRESYATCGGYSQSPVDLRAAARPLHDLDTLVFTGYDKPLCADGPLSMENNGHSAVLELSNAYPTLSGGGLPEVYKLIQFHFHWGSAGGQGSEHTVDGEGSAGELHFVHIKGRYASIDEALATGDPQGVAVLAVFIQETSGSDNPNYQSITDSLSNITTYQAVIEPISVTLSDLLPNDTDTYYRYQGSLTTPECNEAVLWTILATPIQLSTNQIDGFRRLRDSSDVPVDHNYRPTQPLNDRTVFRSAAFGASSSAATKLNAICFIVGIIALLTT